MKLLKKLVYMVSAWVRNVMQALSRLLNALVGGDSRSTVSGRTGHLAKTKRSHYWRTMESMIDFSFEPVDGPGHCRAAMKSDGHYRRGGDIGLAILIIAIALICIALIPITYFIGLFVEPQKTTGES